jgi:hypothetical protein
MVHPVALRDAPTNDYSRMVKGPLRLHLDEIAHVVSMLEERGEETGIEVGELDTRLADKIDDLRDALPRERQTICLRRTGGPLGERTVVLLDRNRVGVRTSTGDAQARVLVDRIAQYLEARPHPILKPMQGFGWWLGGSLTLGLVAVSFVAGNLLWFLAAGCLYGLLVGLLWRCPRGAVFVMRNRAETHRLRDESRRTLAIAAVSAAVGSIITWLLTR